jgi:nicotinamidase-related amidase
MKILILVDCQNDFIDGALRNEEAIKKVDRIVNKIHNDKYERLILTFDTHFENTYNTTLEGTKLPIQHCIVETEGWFLNREIHDAIYKCKAYPEQVMKETFGSLKLLEFVETMINDYKFLPDETVEIELWGFCTDICVISNALLLRAKFPNYKITVDASCCAGSTIERHNAALEVMDSCQIDIKNS